MSFPRYPKYKASGVEWLGDVPAHWALPSIRRMLARIEQGWSPECDARPAEPGEWGVLKAGCVNRGSFDPSENKALPSDQQPQLDLEVRPGDLLMSRASGSPELVGSTALVRSAPGRLMLSDKIFRLHSVEEVQPAFLAWSFGSRSFRHQIERAISGGDGLANNLPQSALLGFVCPRPSRAEQLAITEFLDRETAKIDALVAQQQRLIELLKEKRQAVISHAVTKGMDPNAKMKPSGIEWLGDVPAHWRMMRVKQVASVRYGIGEPPAYHADGVPLIRATNVHRGVMTLDGVVMVRADEIPAQRIVWLEVGDIIVVRSGAYTGDSAIVPEGFPRSIAGFDMVLRCHAALAAFVQATLLSYYVKQRQIDVESARAAQPHLNAEELGSCILLLPPLEEQKAVVEFLDREAAMIDSLVAEAERAITLLQERRTALISAAVTGQIDITQLAKATA